MDEENMKDEESMTEDLQKYTSLTPNEKPEVPEPKPDNVIPNLESLSGFDPTATLQSETIMESTQAEVEFNPIPTEAEILHRPEQQPSTSPPPTPSPEVSPESEPVSEVPKAIESPVDNEADRLICSKIRFFCTEHNVALVMKALCERVPEALPNYRTWAIADPIPVIHDMIQTAGYVEKKLPVLKLMLTTNLGNVPWTARVLIAMAVYGAIQELVDA